MSAPRQRLQTGVILATPDDLLFSLYWMDEQRQAHAWKMPVRTPLIHLVEVLKDGHANSRLPLPQTPPQFSLFLLVIR
jgi:hypothetical protein